MPQEQAQELVSRWAGLQPPTLHKTRKKPGWRTWDVLGREKREVWGVESIQKNIWDPESKPNCNQVLCTWPYVRQCLYCWRCSLCVDSHHRVWMPALPFVGISIESLTPGPPSIDPLFLVRLLEFLKGLVPSEMMLLGTCSSLQGSALLRNTLLPASGLYVPHSWWETLTQGQTK